MVKKLVVHTRMSMKLIIVISIAFLFVVGFIASFYKVSYSVNIDGEIVGYTDDKSKLQTQINDYIENGESENSAFVQVNSLPQYGMCLVKKDVGSDDEKIFDLIKSEGTPYYRYYAILDNHEEKIYVSNFTEAESIVNQLKEKKSSNMETITILEKYETELKDMTSVDDAVAKLYVKPKEVVVASNNNAETTTSTKKVSSGTVNTSTKISSNKVGLGVSLIKPITGTLSSRFGSRSSVRSSAHTGLDIAAPTGKSISVAASGKVTFSGWKGSYGNLVVITHSNGVQTYYGHCSKLYVSAGQSVSQGQSIAAVGSTGNSTGPHLHFEIRVNGVAYNPQNYVY